MVTAPDVVSDPDEKESAVAMSARDDYPRLVHLAGASEAAREQAHKALDDIDALRRELAGLRIHVAEVQRRWLDTQHVPSSATNSPVRE